MVLTKSLRILTQMAKKSKEKFNFWNLFIDVITPVINDLKYSYQQAIWVSYYLSLVELIIDVWLQCPIRST